MKKRKKKTAPYATIYRQTTVSQRAKRPREQSPHRVLGKEANRPAPGKTWKMWSWKSRSPTGLLRSRPRGDGSSRFSATKTISVWTPNHDPQASSAACVSRRCSGGGPRHRVLDQHKLPHRRDYRDLPIVTIDGETASDFDDAVLVPAFAPTATSNLHVHIADVAHYVTEDRHRSRSAAARDLSVFSRSRCAHAAARTLHGYLFLATAG